MGLFSKVVDFASSAGGGGLIGGALGAVGSLVGSRNAAAQAQSQMDMQREFAQNGIRWKVADAKAAGIHPLAALGAQTFSYNPVITGDTGVGEALAKMGQGVSRAVEAKQLQEERALNRALQVANIDKVKAETDYVRQQAEASKQAVAKTALPPAMPAGNNAAPVSKPEALFTIAIDGRGKKSRVYPTDFATSTWEDRPAGTSLTPLLEAEKLEQEAKLRGTIVDGHIWSPSLREFVPLLSRDGQRARAYWKRVGSVPRSHRALVKYPRENMNRLDGAFFDWIDGIFGK